MALPNESFTELRFVRSPVFYALPINEEGSWFFNGAAVEARRRIQTGSLIVPVTLSSGFIGENEEEEETFECYIEKQSVYSFKLVNFLYDAPCFNWTIDAPRLKDTVVADRDYFSNQFPSDVRELSFDFRNVLAFGEEIVTTEWTSEVQKGEDPDAAFFLIGSPVIDGKKVTHQAGNGLEDVLYKLTATITTDRDNSHTLCGFVMVRELCEL